MASASSDPRARIQSATDERPSACRQACTSPSAALAAAASTRSRPRTSPSSCPATTVSAWFTAAS
jgi:hypothetical protein